MAFDIFASGSEKEFNGQFISVKWNNINAERFIDVNAFMNEAEMKLEAETRREAEITRRALYRTTRTWETHVVFNIEVNGRNSNRFSFVVWTDSQIFRFINDGTDRRFYVMTPDYRSKTHVRVIGSRQGRGRKWYYDPNPTRAAQRGIEGREFIDEITSRREPWFYKNMGRIFDDVMSRHLKRKGK